MYIFHTTGTAYSGRSCVNIDNLCLYLGVHCLMLHSCSQVSHFPSKHPDFSPLSNTSLVLSVSAVGPFPATVFGVYSECVSKRCVYLIGVPPGSQLSSPASPTSPTQDIWVLRSSPTGKGVWSQTPPPLPQTLCDPVEKNLSQPF